MRFLTDSSKATIVSPSAGLVDRLAGRTAFSSLRPSANVIDAAMAIFAESLPMLRTCFVIIPS